MCDSVVSPHEVAITLVNDLGKREGILHVLRCKEHPVQGCEDFGAITTLWALHPKNDEATRIHESMGALASRVHNLDVCALLSFVSSIIFLFAGIIFSIIVAAPAATAFCQWLLPLVIFGVSLALCVLGSAFAHFSKCRVREWLSLSKNYLRHCDLVQIQEDTEKFTMLTMFPPTCRRHDPLSSALPIPNSLSAFDQL
ncbi:hypothetical protein [Chlamydia ibidis]|nr:hypothetical protein [Chlamydia ibidis]